jgi:hypothetical protein
MIFRIRVSIQVGHPVGGVATKPMDDGQNFISFDFISINITCKVKMYDKIATERVSINMLQTEYHFGFAEYIQNFQFHYQKL